MALHADHAPSSEELALIREANADGSRLWNDYLSMQISDPTPALRLLNLETAVTRSIDNDDVRIVANKVRGT